MQKQENKNWKCKSRKIKIENAKTGKWVSHLGHGTKKKTNIERLFLAFLHQKEVSIVDSKSKPSEKAASLTYNFRFTCDSSVGF